MTALSRYKEMIENQGFILGDSSVQQGEAASQRQRQEQTKGLCVCHQEIPQFSSHSSFRFYSFQIYCKESTFYCQTTIGKNNFFLPYFALLRKE